MIYQGNVLLDSDFRCQITDFGLTAYFGTSVGQSTDACLSNCAPPEQFMCTKCGRTGCDGYCEGNDARYKSKTTKTDVYAFGCLYYTVRAECVNLFGALNLDIYRYSLILFRFKRKMAFKLCNWSQVDSVRND